MSEQVISIDKDEKENEYQDYKGNVQIQIVFDAIKSEYDHSVNRSDKLDNKVYILLSACAFLFIMLSDNIKSVSGMLLLDMNPKVLLFVGFFVSLFVGIVCFIILLILLMILLRGVELNRYRTAELLEEDIAGLDSITALTFVGARLEKCTIKNDEIIEKRFKRFNHCTRLAVVLIIDLIILTLIRQFIC